VRTGDWIAFFHRAVRAEPWRDVLATWWPRLLPGIAAGATHGVIRVGHAVRALLDEETGPRVDELGQGLAYWAARWQPLAPAGRGPYPSADPRSALDLVPRVPDQRFGIRNRLAQLADLPGWERAAAPAAVLRTLPALPPDLHGPNLAAAWAAAAAVTAAYSPATPAGREVPAPGSPAEVMRRAADDGDAHAIKFADAAVEAYGVTGDPELLDAADHATVLISS
jgi:hypothetical protein